MYKCTEYQDKVVWRRGMVLSTPDERKGITFLTVEELVHLLKNDGDTKLLDVCMYV